jgi:putative transposase
MRYVEANAFRAKLVSRAEDWRWSSLHRPAAADGRELLSPSPVPKPANWIELVNNPEPRLDQIRSAIARGHPFGAKEFLEQAVKEYGLQQTVRRTGKTGRNTSGWDSHQLSAKGDNW